MREDPQHLPAPRKPRLTALSSIPDIWEPTLARQVGWLCNALTMSALQALPFSSGADGILLAMLGALVPAAAISGLVLGWTRETRRHIPLAMSMVCVVFALVRLFQVVP